MRKLLLSALCAVVAVVALAVPAIASIPIQNVRAEPTDTTERVQRTGFNIHFELGGSEHIKDLIQQLPEGLETEQFHPTCTEATFLADGCPANTQIGESTVNLTAGVVPQDVSGRIFWLAPAATPFPSLGIVLDSPPPFKPAHQIAEIRINQELGIVESVIRDFPQEAELMIGGGVPIRINSLDVVLYKTFVKNPASCTLATTRLFVTSYEDPNTTSTGSASYRPTGCASLVTRKCKGLRVTISGTPRANTLRGTARRDVISGLGGRDVIRGLGGRDVICGGAGPDRIFGGAGGDLLIGNSGNDRLFGGPGPDRVRGGTGRDVERP